MPLLSNALLKSNKGPFLVHISSNLIVVLKCSSLTFTERHKCICLSHKLIRAVNIAAAVERLLRLEWKVSSASSSGVIACLR